MPVLGGVASALPIPGQPHVHVTAYDDPPDTVVGTWVRGATSTLMAYQQSDGVQLSSAAWSLPIAPGTYDVRFAYSAGLNRGIATIEVDNGDGIYAVLGTIDTYNASTVDGVGILSGVTVGGSALRRSVRIRAATKNGSSSAYYLVIQAFSFDMISGVVVRPSIIKDRAFVPGPGEVSIDEFNDDALDSAWVRVDGTGAVAGNVVWTEGADVLSMRQIGGDTAGYVHGMMRPLTGAGGALAVGDGFITKMFIHSQNGSYIMGGLQFANGVAHGSGLQVVSLCYTSSGALSIDARSRTGYNADVATAGTRSWQPGPVYLRLALIAANTWRLDTSGDGISWVPGAANLSYTMTATHVGFLASSWGSAFAGTASYDFLRRVSGVT